LFVGKPDESKGSGPVWRRGKDGDNFKVLPIPIAPTGRMAPWVRFKDVADARRCDTKSHR